MGICETKNNTTEVTSQKPVPSIKNETMMENSPMISLEIIKSICKINFDHPQKKLIHPDYHFLKSHK